MSRPLRILTLQPFYGGSHRAFIDGWIANSRHEWTIVSLPDNRWKTRMRLASAEMAKELHRRVEQGDAWDMVLATDMMNLAEFRKTAPPTVSQLPTILYFHENQFAYPVKVERHKDPLYESINLESAFAADRIWFNSEFNRQSLLESLANHPTIAESERSHACKQIKLKSSIQHPGIDVEPYRDSLVERTSPLHLIWAARWEHDKNPDDLLATLRILEKTDLDFCVSVVGQSLQVKPKAILQIKEEFADRIRHWGFLPTRDDYNSALLEAACFISTANHEFFGLSAAEAIAAGCIPLLPKRLAYPELLNVNQYPERIEFLYDNCPQALADKVVSYSKRPCNDPVLTDMKNYFHRTYGWKTRGELMDRALQEAFQDNPSSGAN